MKLEPQNARQATDSIAMTGEKQKKRQRRKAPPYTLVWSEEVLTLADISTNEVIELRKKARWRIELAEAALNRAPAVVTFGAVAQAEDSVWSTFQVGKHWFCLEFRLADIRQYVVKLAPTPPDDTPPAGGRRLADGDASDDAPPSGRPRESGADGSKSVFARVLAERGVERGTPILLRYARRELGRSWARSTIQVRSRLQRVWTNVRDIYRNASYNTHVLSESLQQSSRRFAWTLASRSVSFTRMLDRRAHPIGPGARLEPRWVGQNSGMPFLVYSWIGEEPPVDWGADLFGTFPIDWAADLFGAPLEEERVFR